MEQVRVYARQEDTQLFFFLQLSWGEKKNTSQHWAFLSYLWQYPPTHKKKKKLYFITGTDLRFKRWSAGQKWACGSPGGLCDADRRRDELRRHGRRSNESSDSEGKK